MLRQNGASNGNSKNVGSGCQPSKNRYGHDNHVQDSKKPPKNPENWLNQGFSQDDNDVKKKKKGAARAFPRKR